MVELMQRRKILRDGLDAAAGLTWMAIAPQSRALGANERLRLGIIGLRQQGTVNMMDFCSVPDVEIAALCDVDESQFAKPLKVLSDAGRPKPALFRDLRKLLEQKDIHAVSIATPNHWHSLAAIWACQAGKDVHVEKPGSHNLFEGRKMVEAARKYNRIVQHGTEQRSSATQQAGIRFLQEGGLGEIYMAKGLCYKWRDTIGRLPEEPVPSGVDYDLWLGPAPRRSFSRNRFHYNWHWHWEYGNGDIGNQGVHELDVARWGLGVKLPGRITSVGSHFMFNDDQETANWQIALFEFPDAIASGDKKKVLQFEVRHWMGNHEASFFAGRENEIGNTFYGTKGYMTMTVNGWQTFLGQDQKPGPSAKGEGNNRYALDHARNFIEAVRKRDNALHFGDIEEGHYTCALIHLANASHRLKRSLIFDPATETCSGDPEADRMLAGSYRKPFIVPEQV